MGQNEVKIEVDKDSISHDENLKLLAITEDPNPNKVFFFVKKLNPDIEKIVYNRNGDSGFDLRATETVIIQPGETVSIPVGLSFELPSGVEIQVRPRSGLSLKTKLRVVLGTVDSNYRGEVKVIMDNINYPQHEIINGNFTTKYTKMVMNLKNEYEVIEHSVPVGSYIIHKGERIAQAVLVPVYRGIAIYKTELSGTERGIKGFGSSGV